jgi:glycosyltransferase involved in cell wall biosynthesis
MTRGTTGSGQMKITYLLAASYARGGIKICIEHCNRLAELGHEVLILGREAAPDWIGLCVPWIRAEGRLGAVLPESDIVVFSFYEQAYFIREAILFSGAVPVYFAQGDEVLFGDPGATGGEKERASILAARASVRLPYPLLTVSKAAAARIEALGGREPIVIPNGIDRSVFKPIARANRVPLILSIGSILSRFKGVTEIIGALMKLHREGLEFEFVRACQEPEKEVELPFKVEFHLNPPLENLARLYATADVLVGASSNESFYLPPLEAMSCGTAVVCSDLPAVREYAEPNRDFLPFPPGDVQALTRQLRRVLRHQGLRKRLAESGLEAAERMDWCNIMPRLESLFADLLQRKEKIHAALRRELEQPTVRWTIAPE